MWAGWGHASENPQLPELLMKSSQKIVFIGPPPGAMRSLGDKISSTIVAQSARVPTMAWSGDGLTLDCDDKTLKDQSVVTVGQELYRKACIDTVEQGIREAQRIGYPIMIKVCDPNLQLKPSS